MDSLLVLALGLLFLLGLAVDAIGRRVHVPRVTLLIVLGALIGPPGLDILPSPLAQADGLYASVALTVVAFLLGGSLKLQMLRAHGLRILVLSLSVVLSSLVLVTLGLWLLGMAAGLALLLGAVAAATAPAATLDVVAQSGRNDGFSQTLLGIVAIDDAWGVLVFSLALAITASFAIDADAAWYLELLHAGRDIGGAVALGLLIGIPAALLSGRLSPGEPTLLEAVGVVFLCAGLAMLFEVSLLLTGMTCGAVVVNLARHHEQAFHEIEGVEWPFLLLFFVMAGASLDIEMLASLGWLGLGYVLLRMLARLLGGLVGNLLLGRPKREGALLGVALMPQAGVAIGMALVAAQKAPAWAPQLMAITIASTVVFELIGPFATQWALRAVPLEQRPEGIRSSG